MLSARCVNVAARKTALPRVQVPTLTWHCQRGSDMPPLRTLLVDNYDSYTYNLYQLLAEVNGIVPLVVTNDSATVEEVSSVHALLRTRADQARQRGPISHVGGAAFPDRTGT
jgi:hypothetical protein